MLEEKLTYKLRGIFIKVNKEYGHLFKESVYQKLCKEGFLNQGIKFTSQQKIPLYSKSNQVIGFYIPDFIIEGKIIIEIKAQNQISDTHVNQLIRYLKMTKYKIGLLVNFGTPMVQIIRKVYTKH